MVRGFITSLVVFAIGAILDFAVTVNRYQHGFNIHIVGVILMVIGAIGFVVSLVAMFVEGGLARARGLCDDAGPYETC